MYSEVQKNMGDFILQQSDRHQPLFTPRRGSTIFLHAKHIVHSGGSLGQLHYYYITHSPLLHGTDLLL